MGDVQITKYDDFSIDGYEALERGTYCKSPIEQQIASMQQIIDGNYFIPENVVAVQFHCNEQDVSKNTSSSIYSGRFFKNGKIYDLKRAEQELEADIVLKMIEEQIEYVVVTPTLENYCYVDEFKINDFIITGANGHWKISDKHSHIDQSVNQFCLEIN